MDNNGLGPDPAIVALAEWCEKATGPDRELDYMIHETIHGDWLRRNAYTREPGDDGWNTKEREGRSTEDAHMARLIWLHFWMEWAVRNCSHPIVENT